MRDGYWLVGVLLRVISRRKSGPSKRSAYSHVRKLVMLAEEAVY